jgi:site-specific DNA recombinase
MTDPTSPAKKGRTTTSERRALARGAVQNAGALLPEARRNEALLYLRVSSDDSAESNLSIPDQKKKLLKWCDENGKIPRKTYVDEGISAYLEVRRPQYDQMVDDIRSGLFPQVGCVLVYATNRLFRKARKYGNLEEELNSLGIEVVSITQTFAKDAGGYVSKQVTTTFDEYHSIVTSMNVRRAQREMVAQEFWPGGRVRHGFLLVPAGGRRNRIGVDEVEAPLVRKVFELAEFGNGGPPMGVKAIRSWVNSNGYRTRGGAPFGTADIHRMLTFEGYKGTYPFGIDEAPSPYSHHEVQYLPVSAIISPDQFERVQKLLERRDPRMFAAKTVSSPLLLSGLVVCKCGSALTLRTGTSKSGVLYRYYHCSSNNRRGPDACPGVSLPETVLDEAVVTADSERILAPGHVSDLFEGLFDRRQKERAIRDGKLSSLLAKEASCKAALTGLYATAKSVPGVADDNVFKSNLAAAIREARLVEEELERVRSAKDVGSKITPEKVEAFARSVKEVLHGSNRALAKQVLYAIVAKVEVTDTTVRIVGDAEHLSSLAAEESDPEDGPKGVSGVRGYERRWRRERDSNP